MASRAAANCGSLQLIDDLRPSNHSQCSLTICRLALLLGYKMALLWPSTAFRFCSISEIETCRRCTCSTCHFSSPCTILCVRTSDHGHPPGFPARYGPKLRLCCFTTTEISNLRKLIGTMGGHRDPLGSTIGSEGTMTFPTFAAPIPGWPGMPGVSSDICPCILFCLMNGLRNSGAAGNGPKRK